MAQNAGSTQTPDDTMGLKLKGDLGHLQIMEGTTDSEDDTESGDDGNTANSMRPVDSSFTVSPNLLNTTTAPIFGSVQVTHSENVQFGNNTYFNGPVTIKQVIPNSLGVDNVCYTKTEDEYFGTKHFGRGYESDNSVIKSFQCQLWHKVTCSAIVIVILGGICGIVLYIFSKDDQNDSGMSFTEDSKSISQLVAGFGYGSVSQLSIIIIILMLFSFLLVSCSLVTGKTFMTEHISVFKREKNRKVVINVKNGNRTQKHDCTVDPLLIAPNHLRIVSRTDWLAQPVEGKIYNIRQPVPWVIITHTATESCSTQSECVLRVRLIQMFHIESRKWYDIGYNFLVAGDGSAYWGRGWDEIGAHTLGYNNYSIGIAFIGTFNNEAPPKKQIEACQKLIKLGVQLGKISKDYKLFAHRQLASTLSPGDKLFDIIKEWPHFVKNTTDLTNLIPNY